MCRGTCATNEVPLHTPRLRLVKRRIVYFLTRRAEIIRRQSGKGKVFPTVPLRLRVASIARTYAYARPSSIPENCHQSQYPPPKIGLRESDRRASRYVYGVCHCHTGWNYWTVDATQMNRIFASIHRARARCVNLLTYRIRNRKSLVGENWD